MFSRLFTVGIVLSALNFGLGSAGRLYAKPINEAEYSEIVSRYTFVGDFAVKDPERPVSEELFWRYPYRLPKVDFDIYPDIENIDLEMPATSGTPAPIPHLNRGRAFFLENDFQAAKTAWLTGRSIYGMEHPHHKRMDYFTGYAFLNLALEYHRKDKLPLSDPKIRGTLANATTFLSWAFVTKAEQEDEVTWYAMPKALYNMASIYWRYDRYAAAYGAATRGIEFLRATGRKEYRPLFRRLLAENLIKNRSYLEAVRQLDTGIRQDHDPAQGAAMFARVGDIYFDLNNYELASDAYEISTKIDKDLEQISPVQLVLRGESLFWMGKFSEAQKVLHFALEGVTYKKVTTPMDAEFAGYAALRIADSYLARGKLEEAKLEYFKVAQTYRGTEIAKIAKIRWSCMELPFYEGNNVAHARDLLWGSKDLELPTQARELAWACHVMSYTQRERNYAMLDRVRDFAGKYPYSRFLSELVEPVIEVQGMNLKDYLKAGKSYAAISFFEQNRERLFAKLDSEVAAGMFAAYADTFHPGQAAEFFDIYSKQAQGDLGLLRQAMVAAELQTAKPSARWKSINQRLAKQLQDRKWTIAPSLKTREILSRVIASHEFATHGQWIYDLVMLWKEQDPNLICSMVFPILDRSKSLATLTNRVREDLSKIVAAHYPSLVTADESCAVSLLELELQMAESDPATLAQITLTRDHWTFPPPALQVIWSLAELLSEQGNKLQARKLWRMVQSKGKPGDPVVTYAAQRLDTSKTEFEQMWE